MIKMLQKHRTVTFGQQVRMLPVSCSYRYGVGFQISDDYLYYAASSGGIERYHLENGTIERVVEVEDVEMSSMFILNDFMILSWENGDCIEISVVSLKDHTRYMIWSSLDVLEKPVFTTDGKDVYFITVERRDSGTTEYIYKVDMAMLSEAYRDGRADQFHDCITETKKPMVGGFYRTYLLGTNGWLQLCDQQPYYGACQFEDLIFADSTGSFEETTNKDKLLIGTARFMAGNSLVLFDYYGLEDLVDDSEQSGSGKIYFYPDMNFEDEQMIGECQQAAYAAFGEKDNQIYIISGAVGDEKLYIIDSKGTVTVKDVQ